MRELLAELRHAFAEIKTLRAEVARLQAGRVFLLGELSDPGRLECSTHILSAPAGAVVTVRQP
jgi:hypothetical protein